jgi:SAM-dependent methyltransferase
MKRSLVLIVLIGLAVMAVLTIIPQNRVDLASPEDTLFLWDGLYLGKQTFADVPYVSTPHEVVNEMIRLAEVKAGDVVYDLGCGDGRLVIAAVKKAGCRGVGVDIDAELITVSESSARAAGVEDRVRFVKQDFFEADIREATVMLIYLFTHVNMRLRPKFLSEMKPGSRLVSHDFDMGDWRPDLSTRVGARQVHFWLIPANVTGTWTWNTPGGRQAVYVLKIEQRYQQIRGALARRDRKAVLSDVKLAGDRITFRIEEDAGGRKTAHDYAGTIKGDTITGTISSTGGPRVRNIRWKAVRDPSTVRPIAPSDFPGHQQPARGGQRERFQYAAAPPARLR